MGKVLVFLLFFVCFCFFFNLILLFNFTILYWFCHISIWICHRYTCVPRPEPSSLLPPHTIPLGRPSAPAPSIQYRALNLDWRLVSYTILYMFQCHSLSSHPFPLPQSPKDCSIHMWLCRVLVAAHGLSSCGMQVPESTGSVVGAHGQHLSYPSRDRTRIPCIARQMIMCLILIGR